MLLFPAPLVRRVIRAVVGWLDDRGQAPIMRQHINSGTQKFRADEDEHRGRSALEDILGAGAVVSQDDDEAGAPVDYDTSLLNVQQQYVAANKRTFKFAIATLLSIAVLFGLKEIGPLSSLARIVAGSGWSLVIGAGVVVSISGLRVAQSAIRGVRLRRVLAQRRLSGSNKQ